MAYISRLNLTNFRCYETQRVNNIRDGLVVLHGANGAGKTNVLEAISLLTAGRGLRGAKPADIQNNAVASPWAVSAKVQDEYVETTLGTGLDPASLNARPKRIVRINGENVRGQSQLLEHFSCVWLTPQMDGLFLGSSGERRRFLDRLIFSFDKGHAGRVTRYSNALSQRSKLLKDGLKGNVVDPAWLLSLEKQIAETGVAIAAGRVSFLERLQASHDEQNTKVYSSEAFPKFILRPKGDLESLVKKVSALEVEDIFLNQLLNSRVADSHTGGAATGPHKSDFETLYTSKNMMASQCSTGEQKALLIGIILSYAQMMCANGGDMPALLLDEIAAHLDDDRRHALYGILQSVGGQVWLTGTDLSLFSSIKNTAQFFTVSDKKVTCD